MMLLGLSSLLFIISVKLLFKVEWQCIGTLGHEFMKSNNNFC